MNSLIAPATILRGVPRLLCMVDLNDLVRAGRSKIPLHNLTLNQTQCQRNRKGDQHGGDNFLNQLKGHLLQQFASNKGACKR